MNRAEITGKIIELGALRHTPAGIAAVEFKIRHESEHEEAGTKRKVLVEIPAIAFETQAKLIAQAKLDSGLTAKGFLATKSRRSKRLILHVTHIEFIEGA